MRQKSHAGADQDAQRLPERLRGVILPEICRISDLVQHTGLPDGVFLEEVESGRLPGIKLAGDWLIHRRAIERWVCGSRSGPDDFPPTAGLAGSSREGRQR